MRSNIRKAEPGSIDYKQFIQWVTDEWGTIDQLATTENSYNLPLPLLSYEGDVLAGGLCFIHFKSPESDQDVLWVNTLYVDKPYRRRHIAQHLLTHAEQIAKKYGYDTIFVYTVKPDLYRKIGWIDVKREGENRLNHYSRFLY